MAVTEKHVLVVGAGFAGLAAAVELTRAGVRTTLCERQCSAGGLSQTHELEGIRFELGPHIYFDRDLEVSAFWHSLPGVRMTKYQRNTRIYYDGKFIKSPLNITDTFAKLGPIAVARILGSYVTRYRHKHVIDSAEAWVCANFGAELFRRFFMVYNEKIWGIPSSGMAPDWAGQRIKSSLANMIIKSLLGDNDFIVRTFEFPVGGSRAIYQAQVKLLQESPIHEIRFGEEPKYIRKSNAGFKVGFHNRRSSCHFSHIIWTGHLDDLIAILDEMGLEDYGSSRAAAEELKYRNLVVLNYVFRGEDVRNFKEHWIDVHDPSIRALRVTNFSNYNEDQNTEFCGVGVEYNCWPTDEIWSFDDATLQELGLRELRAMSLSKSSAVPHAFSVLKLARAYPVYFKGYNEKLLPVLNSISRIPGLIITGRNGLYKWNNMHHSVKTGMLAARNAIGADHDLMSVKGMVSIGKDTD